MTVAELRDMFARKDLTINKEYQRGSGFWPPSAKSYLIDTMLSGYPIPKLYLFEQLNIKTDKTRREIVDGQQRVSTVLEFLNDGFALNSSSEKFSGLTYSTLDRDLRTALLSYSFSIDVILQGNRNEVLEMFRRLNAYTTPLNAAEKRHSDFNGEFKWAVNRISDELSPWLIEYDVVTEKQSIRMLDAEFVAELMLMQLDGITDKSPKYLRDNYKKFDAEFAQAKAIEKRISETCGFITQELNALKGTHLFKGYVVYSLFAALIFNRFKLPAFSANELGEPAGSFCSKPAVALANLRALAEAHELQEEEGRYAEYVTACLSTTHRIKQRRTRATWLLKALQGKL